MHPNPQKTPPLERRLTSPLRLCTRCLLPETHETILFDEAGVCNVCRGIEYKHTQIDWTTKEQELRTLLDRYRGRYDYDCIVPFSGGKDSVFALWKLVVGYGVKPLVVSFDHGFMRPTVERNTERVVSQLGVDYLRFRPSWQVVKKLVRESLERKGDFCWHCHTGIFSYPMQVAVKWKVPLLFWGEPSAEYTSYYSYAEDEEVNERWVNRFVNLGITAEDMVGFLDGDMTIRDLQPYTYPPIKELRSLGVRSVCLGNYIPWDVKAQVQIIRRELGWEEEQVEGVPPMYGYEKIECAMQGVRDYLKFIKRGYGRTTHLASIDIRNGRLHREPALRLVDQYDGRRPASLDFFLEFLGMSEDEFMEIARRHQISPHRHDEGLVRPGPILPDQAAWDRSG